MRALPLVLSLATLLAACPDPGSDDGGGCSSDADCKGARVCVRDACVDPRPTTTSSSAAPASSSAAGSSSSAAPPSSSAASSSSELPDAGMPPSCTLEGAPCPATITFTTSEVSLTSAEVWGPNGDTYGPVRNDLEYTFRGWDAGAVPVGSDVHPRAFASVMTGRMVIRDGVRIRIKHADGTSVARVDDNLLVEALDPASDTELAGRTSESAVVLGNGAHLLSYAGTTHDGPIPLEGPMDDDPVTCPDQGRCAIPSDAPIENHLPRNTSFRLRISALDHGGQAYASPIVVEISGP